jgi:ankyrin repeat protein
MAAVHGHLEAARLLLDGGADPSLADNNGSTPLMAAAGTGHPGVLRLLLGRGAALDAVHSAPGQRLHGLPRRLLRKPAGVR